MRLPFTAWRRSLSAACEAPHDVVGHVIVDVVGELDEAEALTERALHPPREVARVDREAVPAHARSRGEAHVAERLRGRGVDRFPDVDAEVAGEHRQLVDERDVDVAEGVLEELGELGLTRARHRDHFVDEGLVERLHRGERLGVDARHHLRRVHEVPLRVAGVDALGAVAEVRSRRRRARPEPSSSRRADELFGGTRDTWWTRGSPSRPGAGTARACSCADSMYDRSGTPSRNGVGTVMTATSKPLRSRESLVGQ